VIFIQFRRHTDQKSRRAREIQFSGCGKAHVGTSCRVAVIWIARLYRMFFTFLFSSFLVSKQFITSISNAQARVRKRNISSSKSRPKKRVQRATRCVRTFLPPRGFHQWWCGYRINSLFRSNYERGTAVHTYNAYTKI